MPRWIIAAVAAGLLAGCGGPRVQTGNQNTVILRGVASADEADALKLADKHCAAFGRTARLQGIDRDSDQRVYDCVP